MPSSEYSNTVGGGLKLKGAGVDKKKKRKKSKPAEAKEDPAKDDTDQSAIQRDLADEERDVDKEATKPHEAEVKEFGRTEAQRRFEERRKKRLEERLEREGVQTHKERVQQLNKYLSTLSEHNDMPRIGPG